VRIKIKEDPKLTRKGNDLYQTVTLNLYDAVLGNELIIETLSGKLKIQIPGGTQNGKTIRLKGKGMPVYENPTFFGDLYILIQIVIPEKLTDKQIALFKELKAIS